MSKKIAAVSFANYVQGCNETLETILNSKQIETKNEALIHNIEKVGDLVNPNYDFDAEYTMDSYLKKMLDDYEADPLLERNGGPYKYCIYWVLTTKYETSYFNYATAYSGARAIYFSDGTEIVNKTQSTYTHTWDTTKDVDQLDDGTKVRWVKKYGSELNSSTHAPSMMYPQSTIASTDESPVIMIINDAYSNTMSNSKGHQFIANLPFLRVFVYGHEVVPSQPGGSGSGSGTFYTCTQLEYIKCYNAAVINASSGYFLRNCYNLYKLDMQLKTYANNVGFITGSSTRSFKVVNDDFIALGGSFTKPAPRPGLIDPKNVPLDLVYSTTTSPFITSGHTISTTYPFVNPSTSDGITAILVYGSVYIKNIVIPPGFKYNLNISSCTQLSEEAYINIFNNLADLTESETRTITLGSYVVIKASTVAIALNKNWTISGGIIID